MYDLYSGRAACPFYISDRRAGTQGELIVCEGMVTDVCCNCFSSKAAKKEYANKVCCENYKSCKHYRALMILKYND